MKRVIIFAAILFVLLPPILQAQEREPLAMRIAFEWTAGGGILGGFIGFAAWLTDPGNPNIRLSEQIARGAGLGMIAGAVYSLFIMQRATLFPIQPLVYVRDPLNPLERLTSDPIATIGGGNHSAALAGATGNGGWSLSLPLLYLQF